MTSGNDTVASQLLAMRNQLTAEVWPTAIAAARSGDRDRIRDLVRLKVDIESIDFALAHRTASENEKARPGSQA